MRAWREGWWEMAVETGDLLAPLLGVQPGAVAMHQNVSVAAAHLPLLPRLSGGAQPHRLHRAELPERHVPARRGAPKRRRDRRRPVGRRHRRRPPSGCSPRSTSAPGWCRSPTPSSAAPTSRTPRRSPAAAARSGRVLLLDVYQSTGAVPLELEAWGVDAAVGGSVKWLCGGPGAGYLWVRSGARRDARADVHRLAGRRRALRLPARPDPLRRRAPGASSPAPRTSPPSTPAAPATASSPASAPAASASAPWPSPGI